MNSEINSESKENIENAEPTVCSEDACISSVEHANVKQSKDSSIKKRVDYVKKQSNRRRKWWYFNRGLQPISEAVESKEEKNTEDDPVVIIRRLESNKKLNSTENVELDSTKDTSLELSEGKDVLRESILPQPGYSACFKLIEKFQEAVLDSAVRVIQAAFKRFRERRRFLRIRKAITVIQRNVRKWLNTKHPCLRPAEFDRQSSDSARSDEYRESSAKENEEDFIDEDVETKDHLELPKDANSKQDNSESQHICHNCIESGTVSWNCIHADFQEMDDSASSCSSYDADEGFSSMDLLCCCVMAELSGGLCHCDLLTLDPNSEDTINYHEEKRTLGNDIDVS